jgi:hypothetical protein
MKPISKQTKKVNRDELNIEDKKWKKKLNLKTGKKTTWVNLDWWSATHHGLMKLKMYTKKS